MTQHWREKPKPKKPSTEDKRQQRVTAAVTDAVIVVLKDIKLRVVQSLEREEIDRISVAAVNAFVGARRVEELAEELNDPLPEIEL